MIALQRQKILAEQQRQQKIEQSLMEKEEEVSSKVDVQSIQPETKTEVLEETRDVDVKTMIEQVENGVEETQNEHVVKESEQDAEKAEPNESTDLPETTKSTVEEAEKVQEEKDAVDVSGNKKSKKSKKPKAKKNFELKKKNRIHHVPTIFAKEQAKKMKYGEKSRDIEDLMGNLHFHPNYHTQDDYDKEIAQK